MSISFTSIASGPGARVAGTEATLNTAIGKITAAAEPTTADLLLLQQQMQQWSMMVELNSTLIKVVADAMKGVIQKSG